MFRTLLCSTWILSFELSVHGCRRILSFQLSSAKFCAWLTIFEGRSLSFDLWFVSIWVLKEARLVLYINEKKSNFFFTSQIFKLLYLWAQRELEAHILRVDSTHKYCNLAKYEHVTPSSFRDILFFRFCPPTFPEILITRTGPAGHPGSEAALESIKPSNRQLVWLLSHKG